MPTILELAATITARIDSFRSAMSQGAAATDKFAHAWTKAGQDVSTAATRIGTVVGVAVGGIVAYTAKLGMAFNRMKETAESDFGVMLQNVEAGKKMSADIQEIAAKTPLRSRDLMDATKTLLNYNVAQGEVLPMLTRIGDVAGGNAQKFKSMALAYGQMANLGHLQGQDNRQMVEAGFNPLTEIAKRTGETMEALQDRMSKGKISADEVKQAFIDATSEGGRFFGRMASNAKNLDGQLSTLADNVDIATGKIYKAYTDGLGRLATSINKINDKGALDGWIKSMQTSIGDIVAELEKLIASHGQDVMRSLGDAFLWGAKGAAELAKWIRESGPSMVRAASEWLKFLEPVRQWIAQNPKVVAGIVAMATAFKGLQLLGVVSALSSVMSALGSTIGLMTKIPAMIATIKAAAIAAQGPMVALFTTPVGLAILASLALVAAAFGSVAIEAAKANREAAILDAKFATREGQQRKKVLEYQGASKEETGSYLRNQRNMAEKNLEGIKGQVRGANAPGSGEDERTKMELDRRKVEMEDFIAALDKRLEDLAKPVGDEIGKAAAGEIAAAAPGAGAEFGKAANRKEIDKALAQHRNDNIEAKLPGFDKLREFLEKGGTSDDVQQFAGGLKGANPHLAESLAKAYEESDKTAESLDQLAISFMSAIHSGEEYEKRLNSANDKVEGMREKLYDLEGVVPTAELKQFADRFMELRQQFLDGKLTSDQYRDSLKNLDNRMNDAKQVGQGAQNLGEDISRSRRRMFDMNGDGATGPKANLDMVNDQTRKAAFSKLDSIGAAGDKLGESFKRNEISAAQYAREMERLKKATDDVTEAALREEQEKRRQALLRGDFKGAGLDFNKAVEDKVADQQMRQFDQAVQDFVNQFIPLTQYTQTISDGFSTLTDGISKFGGELNKGISGLIIGGGTGGTDSAALASFYSWVNSVQGQVAQLWNQIQSYQQAINMLSDYSKQQPYIDAINALTAQIQSLNRSVSTFNGYRSYDPIFRDPGISGTSSNNVLNNTINLQFPSMVTATQGEIEFLANQVSASLSRQGNSSFKH